MNLSVMKHISNPAVRNVANKTLGRGSAIVRRHSPEILTGVGIVGVVTSAVFASKATLKLEPVVDGITEHKNLAKQRLTDEEFSVVEYQKEVAHIYTRGTIDIVRLYGPAVTIGASSIACLLGAHGIMRQRNVALAAAYTTMEKGFSEYRKRVVEEFGEEKDRDFRMGVREEVVTDSETGKAKTVIKADPNSHSVYARFFDEQSSSWVKTPEYNLSFLRCQQNFANDLLQSRGHIFLNEVYDMIGVPRTQAGSVVGWVISKEGDNYVDFGMYDFASDKAREFINGHERSILLDFNVNGVIYDQI